jgi:hypothetical protein
VNYIKNGWINRNRLLLSGTVGYFTAPLSLASPFQKIRDVKLNPSDRWRGKLLKSIRQSYGKAPHFVPAFDLVTSVIMTQTDSISEMAKDSVTKVMAYLGLPTAFIASSALYENDHLSGPERVLNICRQTGAHTYINLPGGRALYDPAVFAGQNIALSFLDPELPPYRHASEGFTPGLSILDLLMWNDLPTARAMVTGGKLS